jgi:hypothetical protein
MKPRGSAGERSEYANRHSLAWAGGTGENSPSLWQKFGSEPLRFTSSEAAFMGAIWATGGRRNASPAQGPPRGTDQQIVAT